MKILGERFGKKFGKGKKSDMDFVKTDVSKVRRLQEELVVEVRNLKAVMQEITGTIERLQTKNNATPDPINDENENKNTNSDTNDKNNNNNNTKTESSLGTPKIVTIPYSLGDHKTSKRIQKKTKTFEESLSESESESSSTTSQDSGNENNRKTKKNQKSNKSKRKSGQKEGKSTKSDENKNDMRETLPYLVPQMTNPMQDFRQNVYPPGQG